MSLAVDSKRTTLNKGLDGCYHRDSMFRPNNFMLYPISLTPFLSSYHNIINKTITSILR